MASFDFRKKTTDSRYPKEWVKLRREIEEWATDYDLPYQVPSLSSNYRNLKIAVYTPIRLALRLKTINDISSKQVPKARKIFYKIKEICDGQ